MKTRIARIAVAFLVAGTLPSAPDANAKTTAAKPAHGAAHTKSARAFHATPLPAAYAIMPEAERLAIEGDVVWLGQFDGLSAEEFDGHMLDAIKAFQRRNGGKDSGVLSGTERALLSRAAESHEAAVGWRPVDDAATGARLNVPDKLVPYAAATRTGSRWTSAHGQIEVETSRLREASLPAWFEEEKRTARRRPVVSTLNPDSFVIIGEQGLKKFVERVQSNGGEVRGVTILYDQATEGTMATVAVAIADTFVGFPDPGAVLPSGRKRGVEYGSGVVATSRGDIVAPAELVDDCQSITVAGLGHAEPIAEDKSAGLALLRLYGARDLVTAPLGGDGKAGTELTLFGVADPVAQADGAAVTEAVAQVTLQGLSPPPKLGFSGALAVDAQGRFAGIVALTSPVVAAAGPAAPQAILVPAFAVRGFLVSHGIALASGNGVSDQSVVRLICVRR